jgi:hypothetical protein
MKLSPQQTIIVEKLRCMDWVCSSEFGYIKDDRRRITDLNRGYMAEKGYKIIGEPCDGRCGKSHSSGLFMRKAVPLTTHAPQRTQAISPTELAYHKELCRKFNSGEPVFSVV